MTKMQKKLQMALMPAVIVTLALLAVNWALMLVGQPAAGLYSSVQPVSAVTGTLGERALGWIGGIVPLEDFLLTGVIALFISTYIILLVGGWLIDQFKLPTLRWPNAKAGKLATKILYGSAVFYVLVIGMVMQQWEVFVGLLIHTVIVAIVASLVASWMKLQLD